MDEKGRNTKKIGGKEASSWLDEVKYLRAVKEKDECRDSNDDRK